MTSINTPDFLDNFNVADMTVGIVGFGYVGQAIENFFNDQCRTVVYDKFKKVHDTYKLDTLEDVVRESNVVFLAVPTPMNKDGSCHTSIVESALSDIRIVAKSIDRDTSEFVIVIKSTVTPGFTKKMQQTGLRVVFSPEFLTEKNSFADLENTSRVLFGGDDEDTTIVVRFFQKKLQNKAVLGMADDPTTLEMVKLFTNTLLMTKVLIANEIFQVCRHLDVDYEEVMLLTCLDPRIARSHLQVPGHDGQLGAGGHCFPKDINSLRSVAAEFGTGEKLFSAVIERNLELREKKDWLEMKGRAVVEDYEEDSDGSGRDPVYSGEFGNISSSTTKS